MTHAAPSGWISGNVANANRSVNGASASASRVIFFQNVREAVGTVLDPDPTAHCDLHGPHDDVLVISRSNHADRTTAVRHPPGAAGRRRRVVMPPCIKCVDWPPYTLDYEMIVQHDHLVTVAYQSVHQVRANETASAGYQTSHGFYCAPLTTTSRGDPPQSGRPTPAY